MDILVERASNTTRDVRQIVLDESLAVAPKLTAEQLDALTLCFLLTMTLNRGVADLAKLAAYLVKEILPLMATQRKDSSCYLHLEYAGCGSVMQIGGRAHVAEHFRTQYAGLFSRGFTDAEATAKLGDLGPFSGIIMHCLHDNSRMQVATLNLEALPEYAKSVGISDKIDELKSLLTESMMTLDQVKSYLVAIDPNVTTLFDLWENSLLSKFALTTVGIAIAQANFRRKTGTKLNLGVWIK